MTTRPQLTLTIKSACGRLFAYPTEPTLKLLLHAKDKKTPTGRIDATCFNAYDVATWLSEHVHEIGGELVEDVSLLNPNDAVRWDDMKMKEIKK